MTSVLTILLSVVAFAIAVIFFAQFFWRAIISYRVTESTIEVRLFRLIPESTTLLKDIVEVKKVSGSELLPWKNPASVGWFRLGNRLWGEGVLVKRSRGIFRAFVITPDKPDEFLDELNRKIANSVSKDDTGP